MLRIKAKNIGCFTSKPVQLYPYLIIMVNFKLFIMIVYKDKIAQTRNSSFNLKKQKPFIHAYIIAEIISH